MYRAWKRSLILFALFAAALAPAATASAYHTGSLFDRPPGAGGAGGLFYTGADRERGWTCTACHVEPAGQIRIAFESEPAELAAERRYVPGRAYVVTVRLLNEHLGQGASRSNYNGIALTVADDNGTLAGSLSGFAAEQFYARGRAILASAGTRVGEVAWTFTWTAPEAGTGDVVFHLGVVDGDGAGSGPDQTLTDPFGDDVLMVEVALAESAAGSAACEPRAPPVRPRAAPSVRMALLAVPRPRGRG
jgi:hypothetical protein